MPINSSNNDLPRSFPNSPLRGDTLIRRIAKSWWDAYQVSDKFGRDRAMPELPLRASSISKRCDRALWYSLTETPESNPPDAAAVFRMMLGQMIHDLVDAEMAKLPDWNGVDAEGRKHGWFVEESIDLRPAGFPGSAHGDVTHYTHGQVDIVGETKSQAGFGFKLMTTNFKGAPEGPRWEHIMQAMMAAVALEAKHVIVMYLSMESISPDLAKSMQADEFGRFTAQWEYNVDEWRDAVRIEAARQRRILHLADTHLRPERSLSIHDIPGGAVVTNVDNGAWQVVDIVTGRPSKAGKTWHCGYCNWRDQCRSDGPSSEFVEP